MTRRDVMKSILQAAAASAIMSFPATAWADSDPKYALVVNKANEIVAESTGTMNARTDSQMDDLLSFMLAKFPKDIDVAATRAVFDPGFTLARLDEREIAGMAESAVPVAVVRELIRNRGVRFAHNNVPSWRPFAERYREALK